MFASLYLALLISRGIPVIKTLSICKVPVPFTNKTMRAFSHPLGIVNSLASFNLIVSRFNTPSFP